MRTHYLRRIAAKLKRDGLTAAVPDGIEQLPIAWEVAVRVPGASLLAVRATVSAVPALILSSSARGSRAG